VALAAIQQNCDAISYVNEKLQRDMDIKLAVEKKRSEPPRSSSRISGELGTA